MLQRNEPNNTVLPLDPFFVRLIGQQSHEVIRAAAKEGLVAQQLMAADGEAQIWVETENERNADAPSTKHHIIETFLQMACFRKRHLALQSVAKLRGKRRVSQSPKVGGQLPHIGLQTDDGNPGGRVGLA